MIDIFKKGGLQRKIFILMLVVGVFPGIVGITSIYFVGKRLTLDSAGPGLVGTAEKAASEVDTIFRHQLREVYELGQGPHLLSFVKKANLRYRANDEEKALKNLEDLWNSGNPAFRKSILENEIAHFLKTHENGNPELYCHTMITDEKGSLVASTIPVERFSYAGETWWKEAMSGKSNIEGPHECPAGRGNINITFAIPILNPEDKSPVGVLYIEHKVSTLLSPLKMFHFGKTGHLDVVSSKGLFIMEPFGVEHKPVESWLRRDISTRQKGWTTGVDEHDREAAIGFAPVKFNDWYVILSQDIREIYAPMRALMWGASIPGFLTVLLLALLWFQLSRKMILTPVSQLSEGAYLIGHGHLDHRLDIKTGDELEKLAHEFNTMAENLSISQEKLKRWNDELREEVAKRTSELEETNAELHESKDDLQKSLQQVMALNNELQTNREELSKRNDDLASANVRLREMDRLKSEFLANMSHELRTPLTAIIGFSELLVDRVMGEINDEQAGCIENVLTSGQHLLKLINDILDLSKIEAGKMELHLETFELSFIIDFVRKTISSLAEKKGLALKVDIAEDIPHIYADPGKIKQLLINLVGNAIKFTPEGGTITIGAEFKDGCFIISVADTGIGIRQEDRDRIFQEFQQAEGSTSREYGGTGLGLTLTRKLTEMHGGKIELESEHGKGSKFTVYIPMRIEKRAPMPSKKREERGSVKPLDLLREMDELLKPSSEHQNTQPLILVVEDDPKLSKLLSMYLSQAGYRVETAMDGDEAIRKALDLRPFAITLDIMLPRKDGWEVLQELKGMPETRDIPVIIVSMVENEELGFSLGAMDYLVKPISREDLLRSIGRYSYRTRMTKGMGRILVVDDDPKICEFVATVMRKEGYHVDTAPGGEDGLRMAIEGLPDLIILDLMMPKVTGFDVIKELKKYPDTKDIPIFVLTAKDLSREEKEGLLADAAKVVQKGGISKEDLIAEIKRMEILQPDRAGLIDDVTGLFNHRYFVNRASYEVGRGHRYGREVSVALIDIDSFGHYIEVNGQLLGDVVLKDISRLLCNNLRKADIAMRYTGGKFAILFPETGKESTMSVSEKLNSLIEGYPFPKRESQPLGKVTVSISVATYPADGNGATELIGRLEAAIERAVNLGGNRVLNVGEVQ